jgi:ABC-type sugar transport system substrate-binding protein
MNASKNWKTRLSACALTAALLPLAALTGCNSASRAASDSRLLYQPPVLRLRAGTEVPTPDGTHQPQVDEVWHSDARYRDLETRYIDTLAALAAEQRK